MKLIRKTLSSRTGRSFPPKMELDADPDFLSLVETNWLHPAAATNSTSAKAHARLQEQKKAFWNELITLRLVPPAGGTSTSAVMNIPRFRLTKNSLREVVNRGSPKTLIISHLRDQSRTVILPTTRDLQAQCKESLCMMYSFTLLVASSAEES